MVVAEEQATRVSLLREFKAVEHQGKHGGYLAGVAFGAIVDNERARQVSLCLPHESLVSSMKQGG